MMKLLTENQIGKEQALAAHEMRQSVPIIPKCQIFHCVTYMLVSFQILTALMRTIVKICVRKFHTTSPKRSKKSKEMHLNTAVNSSISSTIALRKAAAIEMSACKWISLD